MNTAFLVIAGCAGGGALIYGEAGRRRTSRVLCVIAAVSAVAYAATGGPW
jgi:hypothetical protein